MSKSRTRHKIIKMKVQRKRIRPPKRKANHVIKQVETPQIRDSRESGFNSPDRPQTVEIHAVQSIDTDVNISVNM